MKFLPILRPVAWLALAATLCSCDTAADRRVLYNDSTANGPWHDYQRRRDAESQTGSTGVESTTTTTMTTRTRASRVPESAPLPEAGPAAAATTAAPPPPPVVPDQMPGTPPAPTPVTAPAPAATPDATAPAAPTPAAPATP